jgi:hypothetical protein
MDTTDSSATAVSTHSLKARNRAPEGWVLHVHPEGWIYFHHPCLGVITEEDVRIPEVAARVHLGCSTFAAEMSSKGIEVLVLLVSYFTRIFRL